MRVAAVIPARLQSTRLPRKPLLPIAGVPMILRVLDRARACRKLQRVIVATDSEEIRSVVERHGGEARMTSPRHRTGSDRVAEVAAALNEELILNLQGDEPLVPLSTLDRLVDFGMSCPDLKVATAMIPLRVEADIVNPNIVKVVGGCDGKAIYFSRYPIPYRRTRPLDLGSVHAALSEHDGYFKHIGIYLYRRQFLLDYVRMEPTPLEKSEALEQLRILENGHVMHLVEVSEDSVSVDTREDLAIVESLVLSGQTDSAAHQGDC